MTRRRWGVNRWIILFFTLLGAFFAYYYPPVRLNILVAAEPVTPKLFTLPLIGDFYLTNTTIAIFVVYVILIVIAYSVNRAVKSGELVPKGIAGALEAMIEMGYNMTESNAGKWAKEIFPYFATITLVVLLANWIELIPGVDSIGWLEHSTKGYPVQQLTSHIATVVQTPGGKTGDGSVVVPFLRVPSTDLNFTLALALFSVVMTQVVGFRAQGWRYILKFFNVSNLFSKPFFGVMDFFVGILELISEFSKILSFSFRLFGNIFAGFVLLVLVGTLVPVFAQSLVLAFEFFIGLIQAVVFGLLTMIFMTMATQGHASEHAD